jgi:hypothetical protein
MISMVQLIVARTQEGIMYFRDESGADISKHIVVIKKVGANNKQGMKNKYTFPAWEIS